MGFGVKSSGLFVEVLGSRVHDPGSFVEAEGVGAGAGEGEGLRVQVLGCGVWGVGCGVWGVRSGGRAA